MSWLAPCQAALTGCCVAMAVLVGIVAALGAGFIGTRLGTKRTIYVFGLLRVVAILALLPLATGQAGGLVVFAVVVMTVADTAGSTALNTVIMDSTRRASPGVDFPSNRQSSPSCAFFPL